MPLLVLGALAIGGVVLWKAGDDLAAVTKWAVIGGGVYVVAKATKVI